MKKIITVIFVSVLTMVSTTSAQMGMMGSYGRVTSATASAQDATISTALKDIYKTQNITDQSKIACAKVTNSQFEKLGDAVMGYGITEAQHTAMENMMGGEGSVTLQQAHINMARSYLGCWSNYNSGPMHMPMMGGYVGATSSVIINGQTNAYNGGHFGMMNYGNQSAHGWSMMSGGYYGIHIFICGITIVLVWAFLVLGIMALRRWLKRNR